MLIVRFCGSVRGARHKTAEKIENFGPTSKPDGMLEARNGTLYLAAFEENAIARLDVKTRKTRIVVQEDDLQWPDSMAWGADGKLYVTTSQIHRMPKYHGGESRQRGPFMVYWVKMQ